MQTKPNNISIRIIQNPQKEFLVNYFAENNQKLFEEDFLYATEFINGYSIVKRKNGLFNIATETGRFASKEDFNLIILTNDGLFPIRKTNEKMNFFDAKNETLLCNQDFDYVRPFRENRAFVYIKQKGCNYIDAKGEFISKEFFDEGHDFFQNIAMIKRKNLFNFINPDGKILLEQDFQPQEISQKRNLAIQKLISQK